MLVYSWKAKGVVVGANADNKGLEFEFDKSVYADDAAVTFDTHEQLELATPVINAHLERYGLKMHVGTVAKSSKTEYMVIPPRRNDAIDAADLAPVKTDDRGRRRDLNGLLQVPRRGR